MFVHVNCFYFFSAERNLFINVSTNTKQIKGEVCHLRVHIQLHTLKTNDNIKEPQFTNSQCMLTNENYHPRFSHIDPFTAHNKNIKWFNKKTWHQ